MVRVFAGWSVATRQKKLAILLERGGFSPAIWHSGNLCTAKPKDAAQESLHCPESSAIAGPSGFLGGFK